MNQQRRLLAEAHKHMPQGVAENYRYWGEDRTVFVAHALGCTLTDEDGRDFVDFRLGYGPIILGYRDARVDKAVIEQITQRGTLTGFASELDTLVVKQIKALCPQIDKVRFANSGTEAVMGAVRTARGFTKRDRIAIVEGSFHGLYDEMMWKSDIEHWDPRGSIPPQVIPFGVGVPERSRELLSIISHNDFDALENLFQSQGEQLACVVLEAGKELSKEQVLEYLAPKSAKWQLPDDVVFIDEVPKTSVGKFSKKTLRDRFADYQLPTI